MDIFKLDEEKLGRMLLNLIPISYHLGNKHIKSTLKNDIIPPEGDLEGDFVRDLFILPVSELVEKWYGDEQNVREVIAFINKNMAEKHLK